jgi:hypothetical protein
MYLLLAVLGAAVCLALLPRTLREPRGIELQNDGITVVGWRGQRRHVPWASVTDLEHGRQSAKLVAAGEQIKLDDMTVAWRQLAREIARHVRPPGEPADDADSIHVEEVARCLGITVDGSLATRPCGSLLKIVICFVPALLFLLAFSGQHQFDKEDLSVYSALVGIAVLGLCALSRQQRRRRVVSADVRGLVGWMDQRRVEVPWSAVRRIDLGDVPLVDRSLSIISRRRAAGQQVLVTTDEGGIRFLRCDGGGEQLESGIRALLAARDAGHALPSQGPLSDAAISPARLTGEQDAERGLSQLADDGRA